MEKILGYIVAAVLLMGFFIPIFLIRPFYKVENNKAYVKHWRFGKWKDLEDHILLNHPELKEYLRSNKNGK